MTTPDVGITVSAEEQGVAAALKSLIAELRELKAAEKETQASSLNLGEAFKGLIEILAVEKVLEFGKEVFKTGLAIARTAQITGISSETLSVYSQATEDAGGSVEDMRAGVTKLATVLTAADQGNKRAAKSLALVGLSAKDFVGLKAEDKFKKVADALGSMPESFQRTAASEKLLGDSTGYLLAGLVTLRGEGFQKAREESDRFGNTISTKSAGEILEGAKAFNDLKQQAEGATLQFELGLLPALISVARGIKAAASVENGDGFKRIGENAGKAFQYVSFAILSVGISVGEAIAEWEEIFDHGFATIKASAKADWAVVRGYMTGGIAGASIVLSDEAKKFADKDKEFTDRMAAILKSSKEQQDKLYSSIFLPAPPEPDKPPPGKTPEQINEERVKGLLLLENQQDAIYKAHITALIRELQAEGELYKASESEREAGIKDDFARGIISLKDYYAKRRSEIEASGVEEESVLTRQREKEVEAQARARREMNRNNKRAKDEGPETTTGQEFSAAATRDQAEVASRAQAIADIEAKLALLKVTNRVKLKTEDTAAYTAANEQAKQLAAFDKEILAIQGKTTEAAQAETEAKIKEYAVLLRSKKGATDESVAAAIQKYRELTTAQAAFNEARKAGDTAYRELATQIADEQRKVDAGQESQITADENIRRLKNDQLVILRAISAEQLKQAVATNNDANIEQANNFKATVEDTNVQSNIAMQNAKKLRADLQSSLSSDFQTFFTSGINGATSLADAFSGLATSVVSSLQKMAAEMLTTMIIQKLFGKSSEDSESGGGGGGGGGGFFGFLTNILGAASMAGGGLIDGPGSSTSDSIPIRASVGEYMIKAAAVREIGVATLDAINRGRRPSSFLPHDGVQRFAEGGLVRSGGAASSEAIRLQVSADEGLTLKHLNSRAAGKITITHIANNPKAANAAIGRSR